MAPTTSTSFVNYLHTGALLGRAPHGSAPQRHGPTHNAPTGGTGPGIGPRARHRCQHQAPPMPAPPPTPALYRRQHCRRLSLLSVVPLLLVRVTNAHTTPARSRSPSSGLILSAPEQGTRVMAIGGTRESPHVPPVLTRGQVQGRFPGESCHTLSCTEIVSTHSARCSQSGHAELV